MAENNAYKLKLFRTRDRPRACALYEAGYLPNDSMGEVSLRDAESGLVFISIKPGTFYIADPSDTTAATSPSPPLTASRSPQ